MSLVLLPQETGLPFPTLNMQYAFSNEPRALDFVLPGLVSSTVGALIAPGATGKSWLALEFAALVACGLDLLGLPPMPRGSVMVLAKEDPPDVLHGRLAELKARMNEAQRENFREHVVISPCYGTPGDLLDDGTTARNITSFAGRARLIIVDTLSRWHSGEENDRKDAARVMRVLEGIAVETGAAVVFLHHASKAAVLDGQGDKQQAARGSSVFVDEARWVAFMQTATEAEAEKYGIDERVRRDFVRYGISKANYCPPQLDIWLRREAGGVLVKYEHEMRTQQKRKPLAVVKGGGDDWR